MSKTPTSGDWVSGRGMSGGHLFQPGDNSFSSFCFLLFFSFFSSFLSLTQVAASSKSSPYFVVRCCCQLASWLFCCFCFFFIHFNILPLVVVVVGQVVVASTSKTFLKDFYYLVEKDWSESQQKGPTWVQLIQIELILLTAKPQPSAYTPIFDRLMLDLGNADKMRWYTHLSLKSWCWTMDIL